MDAQPEDGALALGQVMEDAAVAMFRAWRAQLGAWLLFALWSALAWAPVAIIAIYDVRGVMFAGLLLTLLWFLTLAYVPSTIAALIAPAVGAAIDDDATPLRALPPLQPAMTAGFILGSLRLVACGALFFPSLWLMAALGMMPAIMACEPDHDLTSAAGRAMALSHGHRAAMASGVAAGLLGFVGLELAMLCALWIALSLIKHTIWSWFEPLIIASCLIPPALAWIGFEGALLAVFYHRLRVHKRRASLEEIFS